MKVLLRRPLKVVWLFPITELSSCNFKKLHSDGFQRKEEHYSSHSGNDWKTTDKMKKSKKSNEITKDKRDKPCNIWINAIKKTKRTQEAHSGVLGAEVRPPIHTFLLYSNRLCLAGYQRTCSTSATSPTRRRQFLRDPPRDTRTWRRPSRAACGDGRPSTGPRAPGFSLFRSF